MSGLSLGLGIGFGHPLFSGLLNAFPGAAAAYSLRRLSAYGGPVVEVRRSDFGGGAAQRSFTEGQILSGAMLAWVIEFSGTADGFVSTWYDQSGNADDATQPTTTMQPKIVDAGALVVGGLDFNGVDDTLMAPFARNGEDLPLSMFAVFNQDILGVDYIAALSKSDGKAFNRLLTRALEFDYSRRDSSSVAKAAVGGVPVINTDYLWSVVDGGTSASGFINGSSIFSGSDIDVGSQTIDQIDIGANNGDGNTAANPFDGTIAEVIIYPTDESANRAAIETNINAHYSIY